MEETSIELFANKKIALIGDKIMCRHFYLQFRSELDLQYYFSTQINEPDNDADIFYEDLTELTCMFLKMSLVFEQDLLIILCVEHPFRKEYDKLFFQQGLEWGQDYIDMLYVIQYYRHKYNNSLSEKNMWIYGTGIIDGQFFYQKFFKNAYSVAGFLSDNEEEKECMGLPVIRPSELLRKENGYVVICALEDALAAEKLCGLGFSGIRDFCFVETLPKKLFLTIGTCQVVRCADCLYWNLDFQSRYYGCSYIENIYDILCDADNKRLKSYGEFCDVVFYNIANAGTSEFRNYEPLIRTYYKNAKRLFMPFYYFTGQIMQATINGVNPYGLKSYAGQAIWFRGDQEVNHMVEKGYSIERIVEEVLREDYWPKEKILNHFKLELKKIEVLDRFSSFPIQRFIEENYQKISVFVDGTHFHHLLYLYIANKIADTLHIERNMDPDMLDSSKFDFSSMPVYPCVQKALDMETQRCYPFFNIEKEEVEYLDIKEYISRYVRYVMDVRKMYKKTGTDWI